MRQYLAGGTNNSLTWDNNSSIPRIIEDSTNGYIYGPNIFSWGSVLIEQITKSNNTPEFVVPDYSGVGAVFTNTYSGIELNVYTPYGQETVYGINATPFCYDEGYSLPQGLIYFIHRVYDPTTGQFLTIDPEFDTTLQAYSYAGGDPMNGWDPTGLGIGWNTVTNVVHSVVHVADNVRHFVATHAHGIAQIATVVAVGVGTSFCIAATGGLCNVALPFIGAGAGALLYMESGGQHTLGGVGLAMAEGGLGGSIALICVAVCSIAGSLIIGSAIVNGLVGAGFGTWDYSHSNGCHSLSGYAKAAAVGAGEGGIPWDLIVKGFSGGE
jgi:RHS repeat-associated protein